MAMEEARKRLTIETQSSGLDGTAASINKVADAEARLAVTAQTAERATLSQDAAFAKLERRYVEGVRQQQELARVQAQVNAAVAQNPALQERASAVLAGATARLNQVHAANENVAKSTGLARHELINLSRQAQDVGVSLASGQSPFTVLVQQGSQIADIFASSQTTVRQFFGQAAGWAGAFLKSTAGIVTSVLAIGSAAVYAAYQFGSASTTIEQALEEQNRLLKEGKALLDARTSAEARAQLQSKEQTQFETLRNELDLRIKLNAAMKEAADLAASRAGTPTGGGMPEMGVAPSGVGPYKTAPGYDQIIAAYDKLKAATDAGLPGLREYNAELARIGLAYPELALVVAQMVKAGEAGMELERAAQRAKAMSDALKGIATDAQMAAVGLKSLAQFRMGNLQEDEGKESAERYAQAILRIRDNWGGVSIEAAKTLDALSRQWDVAQAVGQMAQIEAQHKARIAELSLRINESEATRIADYERAISLAQIEAQHKQTMVALEGQLSVARQSTGIGQINAQYAATVASLTLQIGQVKAIEQAELQRSIAIANVNAAADQTLKTLQQQGELLQASSQFEKDRIEAAQTYQNWIDKGADSEKARAIAMQQLRNADISRQAQETAEAERDAAASARQHAAAAAAAADENERAAEAAARVRAENERIRQLMMYVPFGTTSGGPNSMAYTLGKDLWMSGNGYSQFNPDGYKTTTQTTAAQFANNVYGAGGFGQDLRPNAQGYTNLVNSYLTGRNTIGSMNWADGGGLSGAISGLLSSASGGGGTSFSGGGLSAELLQAVQRLTNLLPDDQKASVIEQQLALLRAKPQNIETLEAIRSLEQSLDQLRQSTDSLKDAMTDVLSPFYSQDPRNMRLGFRAFAGGGIMSPWGEIPIKNYAGGGIATSPQVSIFGEGSTPEAYVPVPNGRIPVEMAANSNQPPSVTINNHFHGPVTREMADQVKKSGYQQAQQMRRAMGA